MVYATEVKQSHEEYGGHRINYLGWTIMPSGYAV
jgi:hypothetical protein